MGNSNRDNDIPMLVQKVMMLNINNANGQKQLMNLSESLFNELGINRATIRNKVMVDSNANKKLFAKYEAEQEIVVGLLFVLQEKVINFINIEK